MIYGCSTSSDSGSSGPWWPAAPCKRRPTTSATRRPRSASHLSALQRETGLTLFEKAGRGIAPTPAAEVLALESEEVMGSLSRLGAVVDQLRDGHTGTLTIGTFDSAAEFWLPHVARGLQRDFPDLVLELSLDELGGAGQREPVRRDIEVVTEPADVPGPERPGYRRHVLSEEGYRAVIPQGHPS